MEGDLSAESSGSRGRRYLRHPFVGRQLDLGALKHAYHRTLRESSVQLVTIVGEPGVGKTRLLAELSCYVDDQPELVSWRQGRCLPYGDGITFWALGEIVKAHAGILESNSSAEATDKLAAAILAVIDDDTELPWFVARLSALVGASSGQSSDGVTKEESFAAWRRFLEAVAAAGPLVLVFEDLPWADATLLEFIEHLVEWVAGVPLMLVCTTRPELLARRGGWGRSSVNSATILLSPLSHDETAALFDALLGESNLSVGEASKLLERAGGNPLYAEEFARMVRERGDTSALPESVQGLIAARLDALPYEEKELLQEAAVMGRVFWLGALGRDRLLLEERMHELARKEFVRPERRSSVAGEGEYSFRHTLIREVAYEQIPKSQRAAKHRAAADWLQSQGRREDHAEMLAHHYIRALEYAKGAGELPSELTDRAMGALRAAGDHALSLNAYPAAIGFYEHALGMVSGENAERTRCDLLLSLGDAQARAGDPAKAKETFLAAADLARRSSSAEQLGRAALGYGGRFVWARAWGDKHLVPLLEQALTLLPDEDSELRARLLARLAAGPLRDTLPLEPRESMSREALQIARRLGDPATLAYALEGRHGANMGPDSLELRLATANELIEVSEGIGQSERAYAGYEYQFHALLETGDLPAAYRAYEAMTGLANELRQPAQLWFTAINRAKLALFTGSFHDAENTIAEALELGRHVETANPQMAFLLQMYALRREQGRLDELVDEVERAVDDSPEYPVWRYVLADVLAELRREDKARAVFDDLAAGEFPLYLDMQWLFGMSVLPEACRYLGDAERAATLYRLLSPYEHLNATLPPELCRGSVSRGLGILAATMSRWDQAIRHFEIALGASAEMGARSWLAHAQYDYGHMLLARAEPGDRERAHQLLAAARSTSSEQEMKALADRVAALAAS